MAVPILVTTCPRCISRPTSRHRSSTSPTRPLNRDRLRPPARSLVRLPITLRPRTPARPCRSQPEASSRRAPPRRIRCRLARRPIACPRRRLRSRISRCLWFGRPTFIAEWRRKRAVLPLTAPVRAPIWDRTCRSTVQPRQRGRLPSPSSLSLLSYQSRRHAPTATAMSTKISQRHR